MYTTNFSEVFCKKHKWVINLSSAKNVESINTICVHCGKEKTLIDILDLKNEPNIIPDIIDKLDKS